LHTTDWIIYNFVVEVEQSGMYDMTKAVQHLLQSFDLLSETEKQEVVAELLRRSRHLDIPVLSDEELTLSAEKIFLELDRRESEDA
jgi:hypothetical protein